MQKIIKDILDDCYADFSMPKPTRMESAFISVEEGLNIIEFNNQIQEIADSLNLDINTLKIGTEGVDVYSTDIARIGVFYDKEYPIPEKEYKRLLRGKFERLVWYRLYKELIAIGYKRESGDNYKFRKYKDTTVYDMYINKEFTKITDYYSLFFKKENTIKE